MVQVAEYLFSEQAMRMSRKEKEKQWSEK